MEPLPGLAVGEENQGFELGAAKAPSDVSRASNMYLKHVKAPLGSCVPIHNILGNWVRKGTIWRTFGLAIHNA